MAAADSYLDDIGTVITNGPAAATVAAAIAAAGPINDYVGNSYSLQLHLREAKVQLTLVKSVTDSGDTANLALINKLLAALNGTATPSTVLLTDIQSVIDTAPGAATTAAAIAAAGPIMDYFGMLNSIKLHLQEAYTIAKLLHSVTDNSTDSANKTLLADMLTGLA